MSNAYAFIDEVWGTSLQKQSKGSSKKAPKMDPACGLYKRRNGKDQPLDDIMTTYMDEAPHDKYEPVEHSTTKFRSRERNLKSVDIGPNKYMYDLTDAFPSRVDNEEPTKQSKCYNADKIEGVYEPIIKNTYDYNRYYADSIVADDQEYEEETSCIINEPNEHPSSSKAILSTKPLPKDEVYRDIILEKYQDYLRTEQSKKTGIPELVLYIGSGVMLIFMMEQIFQLGMHLR